MSYGQDAFLFLCYEEAILDWNVSGRYHDLLKVGYQKELHALHLVLAFNQNDEKINGGSYYAPGGQPYKNMQTLWYH